MRTFDTDLVNSVVNDPAVYPWVHGTVVGPLDMSPVVEDRRNYCLFGEHGGVIYKFMQPGLYEAHTQVKRSGRGKWTVDMVFDTFAWMFSYTEAVELLTRVPKGNLAAKALVKSFGSTFEFTRPNAWVKDHKMVSADVYSYSIQNWIKEAPGLVDIGASFNHQVLHQYRMMGAPGEATADENRDRYLGAAVSMIQGGQAQKGVVFYNRWAAISGYPEISILKLEPVIIDAVESILMIKPDGVKVVSCRQHSRSAA